MAQAAAIRWDQIEREQAAKELSCVVEEKRQGRPGQPSAWWLDDRERGFVYDGVRCGRALRAGLSRRSAFGQPLPMEELGLYMKSVDNAGVRRRSAPEGKKHWSRTVAVSGLLLMALAFGYGPRAWLRQSGYRIAEMTEKRQALMANQDHLRVRHARLSGLDRVGELAAQQGLIAPAVENYTWQEGISAEPNQKEVASAYGSGRVSSSAILD
jgi:hypothetical protein